MFSPDTLAGKHALVCGSSKGIGQACARELARAGARLTLLARSEASLAQTLDELGGASAGHRSVVCDLNDLDQLRASLPAIGADVDVLVCNSSGPAPGTMLSATVEALTSALSQHLLANHLLVQALAPHMQRQKFGRIINIISTSVKIPLPGLGVSNSVRGAVANWSKSLANELGPFGITVNNILPGFTKTLRLEEIMTLKEAKTGHGRQQIEDTMVKDVPAGRFAEAREIAYACVFLASPLAGYINGINLPVDGGRTGSL